MTLLKVACEDGVYPLLETMTMASKPVIAYVHERTTIDGWHKRLGHPSSKIAQLLIRTFSLTEKQKKIHLFVSDILTIKPTEIHFNLMVLLVQHPSKTFILMFGVRLMTLVLMVQNITLFLLTTILNIYGFIICPINHVFTISFLNFKILWKTGSTPKSKVYILTMEVNTLLLKIIYLFMALVIIPLLP